MKPTFAVIYRWRLLPDKTDQFREGWERVTRALMAERGALGSRLHECDDGTWVAYAQWPDREAWARSREAESVDAEASTMMRDSTAESFEPVLLRPEADFLQLTQTDHA